MAEAKGERNIQLNNKLIGQLGQWSALNFIFTTKSSGKAIKFCSSVHDTDPHPKEYET